MLVLGKWAALFKQSSFKVINNPVKFILLPFNLSHKREIITSLESSPIFQFQVQFQFQNGPDENVYSHFM